MVFDPSNVVIGLIAVLLDRFVGYPDVLYRTIAHPVVWMGSIIDKLDRWLNHPGLTPLQTRIRGIFALSVLLILVLVITVPLHEILGLSFIGTCGLGLLASSFLAQKSLRQHAQAVIDGLEQNLPEGRKAVSKIVGRDTSELDQSDVCKGTIESIAENTSDGVVAPLFWLIVAGLPGIAIYKAINTADSMIAYKTARYKEFGWFSARVDDLVNLPASRLAGALFACASCFHSNARFKRALGSMCRDATKHVSPNAGWTEAALAGALDYQLGGPRKYRGETANLAYMGSGKSNFTVDDITNSLQLYDIVLNLIVSLLAAALILVYL